METIFEVVAIIFLVVVYLFAQNSKKETTRERYGEAIGQVAHSVASTIAGIAYDIVEPASKKEIRLAKKALAYRNGQLYRFEYYYEKERVKKLLDVDEPFEKSLNLLGLPAERWKKIGKHIFYVGVIKYLSRESYDYTKKNQDFIRDMILNEWIKDPLMKAYPDTLREALGYFNISEEEWIKYGDTVIEMYNINHNEDVEEYGIITKIMPMSNNMHLL